MGMRTDDSATVESAGKNLALGFFPTSPRAGSLYQTSPRAGSLVGRPRSLSPMGMRTDAMYQSAPAVPVGQSFSSPFLQQVCCAAGKNHGAAWSRA